jgi:PAS domain S-box-containing protein/putative nucleotidyltransferase with HDIG domain
MAVFASLRSRLILLVLLAFLPAFGLAIYSSKIQADNSIVNAEQTALENARLFSLTKDSLIDTTRRLLISISVQNEVRQSGPACRSFLTQFLDRYPYYTNIGVVNLSGDVTCSVIQPQATVNLADRDYIIKVLKTQQFSTGAYQIGRISNKPQIPFAYPVYDISNKLIGAVYASLDLYWFDTIVSRANMPVESLIVALDNKGTVIAVYPGRQNWVGMPLPDPALTAAVNEMTISQNGSGKIRLTGMDHTDRLYVFTPFGEDTGMSLLIGYPVGALYAESQKTLLVNLLVVTLVAIISLLLVAYGSQIFLVNSIKKLVIAAQHLASGDLSTRVGKSNGAGEIKQLASSFDQMAESVEAQERQIKEAEEALQRTNQALRILSSCNKVLVHADDETKLFAEICSNIMDVELYTRAWVDLTPPKEEIIQASAGHTVALPLGEGADLIGTLYISSDDPFAFDEGQMQLLDELAADMFFGIKTIRNEQDRKRTQNKLQVSEDALQMQRDFLREVIDADPNRIFVKDRQGNFILVNKAFAAFYGKIPEEIVGKNQSVINQDQKQVEQFNRQDLEVIESCREQLIQESYISPIDGRRVFFHTIKRPLAGPDGSADRVLGVGSDVTDRKLMEEELRQSEQRFRSYFEMPLIGFAITSFEGEFLEANERLCQILGYSHDELLRQKWIDLTPQEDLPEQLAEVEQIKNGVKDSLNLEKRYLRKDGKIIFAETSAATVRKPDGSVDYFVVLVQDITARKQRESELEVVAKISVALRNSTDRTEMVPAILKQLTDLLIIQGACLLMLDQVTNELVLEGSVGIQMDDNEMRLPSGEGHSYQVLEDGKPYVVDSFQPDVCLSRTLSEGEPYAAACIPLIAQQQPIGVLWVFRPQPFKSVDVHLLSSIGDFIASAIHRADLLAQTREQLDRLNALHQIDTAISTSRDISATLKMLLDQGIKQLNVDAADVLLFNESSKTYCYLLGTGFRTHFHQFGKYKPGEGYPGKAGKDKRRISIADLSKERDGNARNLLTSGEHFVSYHCVPLILKEETKGVLEVFSRKLLPVGSQWLDFLEMLGEQAAIAIENATLFEESQETNKELTRAYDETIEGWSSALELRHHETQGHSQRVTELTLRIARMLHVDEKDLVHIRRGALLHDIGKMGIPDYILLKPDKLTDEEWMIMRKHPSYAFQMLWSIDYLLPALDIPYCHHEKWDGSGYPRGLRGNQIPLSARVFAIADVWDALISDRAYRPAWTHEEAVEYIVSQSGVHFDPQVVAAFLELPEIVSVHSLKEST